MEYTKVRGGCLFVAILLERSARAEEPSSPIISTCRIRASL